MYILMRAYHGVTSNKNQLDILGGKEGLVNVLESVLRSKSLRREKYDKLNIRINMNIISIIIAIRKDDSERT